MAGVRIRRRTPVPVGRLLLVLAADQHVYVRWTPADQGTGGARPGGALSAPRIARVAAVACVAWAVRTTLTDHGWSRRQVAGQLERACRTPSAADYNARNGTVSVRDAAPPIGTVGPSVRVDAALDTTLAPAAGDGRLVLEWGAAPQLRDVAVSERLLGALWAVADETDDGESVHHALRALRGGFDRSGGFDPSAADDLVASLLAFGDETARSERRAREWRGRLRVV